MSELLDFAKGLFNMTLGWVALFALGIPFGWFLRNRKAKEREQEADKRAVGTREDFDYAVGLLRIRVGNGMVMTNMEKGFGIRDPRLVAIVKKHGAPEENTSDPTSPTI
jgi:hypothetical protein